MVEKRLSGQRQFDAVGAGVLSVGDDVDRLGLAVGDAESLGFAD